MFDYKKNITNKLKFDGRYIYWKTKITDHIYNNIIHQCWNQWCWSWDLCWPGYENIYYDGDHYVWRFGFGSLYLWHECNYADKLRNL